MQTQRIVDLRCDNNSLSSLDVRNNTALIVLVCENNSLSSLDVSNHMALTNLYCKNNSLSRLDVSNNTALIDLNCSRNSLSVLDVSTCTALKRLDCFYNDITNLNVSNNMALTELYCFDNKFTSLDLSNCTGLKILQCHRTLLSGLDVSNTALTSLVCFNNRIPLSDLYAASKKVSVQNDKELGTQTLQPQSVLVGTALFSDQSVFGGEYTKYEVNQSGSPAPTSDYTVTNGEITFHTAGTYDVTMTNDSIISRGFYSAKVIVQLTAVSTDASLSNLTMSAGSLTPAFSSTTYNYTVDVEYLAKGMYYLKIENKTVKIIKY